MKAEDQEAMLSRAVLEALRDRTFQESIGATMKVNITSALRLAFAEALKDREVIRAWAPTIARAVGKGVTFGVLLASFLAFVVAVFLPAILKTMR